MALGQSIFTVLVDVNKYEMEVCHGIECRIADNMFQWYSKIVFFLAHFTKDEILKTKILFEDGVIHLYILSHSLCQVFP